MSAQNDVQEFHPYVFQIFAQLIETRPAPLPPAYMAVFPPLLSPLFWERPGNVPALVRLLQVRRVVLEPGPGLFPQDLSVNVPHGLPPACAVRCCMYGQTSGPTPCPRCSRRSGCINNLSCRFA